MFIRYEANLEDVKRLKDEGVDLVWISSHVDCSIRCQPWQGKLYSISGENAGKTIEGNKVLKLSDALKGTNNDGNGCINGYNCRHYLIEYKKGSKAPKEYDRDLIKKERDINTQQRLKENQIRQIKTQEVLARESGDKELAKKLNLKWHKIEKNYEIYSLKNGRPYYPWRTQVMRGESLEPNKWGNEVVNDIKSKVNFINYKNSFINHEKEFEPFEASDIYSKVKKNVQDVILTKERYKHILNSHPEMEKYKDLIKTISESPSLVLKDNKHTDSIQAIKKIDETYSIFVTIKLADGEDLRHRYSSIISARKQKNKRIIKEIEKNENVIYKDDKEW